MESPVMPETSESAHQEQEEEYVNASADDGDGDASEDDYDTRPYYESTEEHLEYESDPPLSSGDESFTTQTEELIPTPPPMSKTTHKDRVNMIYMRRYLDQLAEIVQKKLYVVEKTKDELRESDSRIEALENERDDVYAQIEKNDADSNTAAVYRLRSQHERVCKELQAEGELQATIKERLEKAEYELAKAQVKQGKYLLAEDELQKRENSYGRERSDIASNRLSKEQRYSDLAMKERQAYDKDVIRAKKATKQHQQHEHAEALKSYEKANKFYKKTMNRLKKEATDESMLAGVETEKRIDTLLKLKGNITSNRENLRAIQARDRAMARSEEHQEQLQREAILADGGNPDEVLIIQKRLKKFDKEKEVHHAKQRQNEVTIVNRILLEEKRMKKRKKQQPLLWEDQKRENAKIVAPHPRPNLQIFEESRLSMLQCSENIDLNVSETDHADATIADEVNGGESAPIITGADSSDDEAKFIPAGSLTRNDLPASDSETEGATDLAKPEFEGLWSQHKPYKVPKDVDAGPKVPGASKMDQEILQNVLEKHRAGIVKKQIVVGKEFKGVAFYSKPDIIHFKDFDVGKSYKKKVILTNVSYTVNYLKLIGITEHLKDFIDIHFDPPGQMSAGLTCEMLVTFKPMINEDLLGEVKFLAQTGDFSVPLRCTTKKCDLTVDTNTVEFGTSVIGETLRRHFTLRNNGALGTKFEFYKVSGLKQRTVATPETSLGGRETVSDIDRPDSPETEDPSLKKDTKALDAKLVDDNTFIKEEGEEDPEKGENGTDALPAGDEVAVEGDTDPAAESETKEGLTSSMMDLVDDIEDLSSLDGMKTGVVASGWIEPFASVRQDILWQPTIPGKVDTDFVLTFDDHESENINVCALANAIDVPVWVERQGVDLKICMFDRLYQDTIIVNNRATTALRLKFEVCKELRNHIELLPKTGYIQAQSQFSAQLKFLPLKSLTEEGGKFFDPQTGVLEAPMIIKVADQTRPVPFTVHAVVTSSDLEFDKTDIDFGHATIYESVKTTVQLTNHSILPQKFGFVGIPEFVDVQPNDGFGTLLPDETIELDIIFNPKKARNYSFELTCKSLINRQFKIQCKGVGVHPPLELSHQVVHFTATSLCDYSTESVYVVNSHTSMNEFTHPVPRIGKGDIAPVGPTSFEFVLPPDAPLNISPAVGTVQPGEKQRIQVRYSPVLPETDVQGEAVRIIKKAMEARAEEEHRQALQQEKEREQEAARDAKTVAAKKGGKKNKPSSPKNRPKPFDAEITFKRSEARDLPEAESIKQDSDDFAAAHGSLLRQYKGDFKTFIVPCYVSSGKCGNPGELDYSIHNTLYLVVHCPSVKPELMVISDNGRTTTNFGEISKGQSIIKSITIQNIASRHIDLESSILDTSGPFLLLNSLRPLPPDGSHTILISFTPTSSKQYYEVLDIHTGTSTLHITLVGRGVTPIVNLSIEGTLDMGSVMTSEYMERPFKIGNTSTLAVDYSIKLDSASLLRYVKSQDVPDFVKKQEDRKSHVGTQNLSGKAVFDCVPSEGTIPAGSAKEIMVTFAPDHESDYYMDGLRLELFGQEESHFFRIVGVSKDHIMYLTGGDTLTPDVESLSVLPVTEEEDDGKPPIQSLLVTFESVSKDDEFQVATREIYVGCVRTMAVSQKKNGEFFFENTNVINGMGFNVEPQKGMIEAGTKKPLVFTWTPPTGHDPSHLLEASIICTVKGDVTQQYKIMLRALVVSG